MSFDAIIDASDHRWSFLLPQFAAHDFHHLPGYVALAANIRHGDARAFLYQDGDDVFLVPFIVSAVPLMLQSSGATQSDAVSPYGYAGPLVRHSGDDASRGKFMGEALRCLQLRLRQRNICSLLLRFHPLIEVPLAPFQSLGNLVLHGETVWVDLTKSPDEWWNETRSRYRSYIRGLERDGYQVEFDAAARDLRQFVELYHETMRRVGATPEYFFSHQYFLDLQKVLGEKLLLAHVRSPAGTIVSSGMFTVCRGIMQYHLSGNSLGDEGSNALKLLLHSMRQWGRQAGLRALHLGGGVGAQSDSLFQFKSGFSPLRAKFHTWRLVADVPAYTELCRRWESVNHAALDPPEGFFPAYRKIRAPAHPGFKPRAA